MIRFGLPPGKRLPSEVEANFPAPRLTSTVHMELLFLPTAAEGPVELNQRQQFTEPDLSQAQFGIK